MRVSRITAPGFGDVVLYFEEYRAIGDGLAHPQRVVSLVLDEQRGMVRLEQWLLRVGPAYDRAPLAAKDVARMQRSEFRREANCDLFDVEPPRRLAGHLSSLRRGGSTDQGVSECDRSARH